jgi:hypothetical protein
MGQEWSEPAGDCTFFYEKGSKNHDLGTGFFVHKRIISTINTVELILRGLWCDAPTGDKTDDMKDSFCEELEHVFGRFRKCHKKVLLEISVPK